MHFGILSCLLRRSLASVTILPLMHPLLQPLSHTITFSGHLGRDVSAFLTAHGCPETAAHCAAVAAEAKRLAGRFGQEPGRAEVGGWLHDISAIYPSAKRASIARQLSLTVLPEEEAYPMIIHQKLSLVLAREIFAVQDEGVLSAIGCHTTLKAGASTLDQVVFIADKIAWDQPGRPPYLTELLAGLAQSLDQGVRVYLQYLWERRAGLRVIHPWFAQTCDEWGVTSDE